MRPTVRIIMIKRTIRKCSPEKRKCPYKTVINGF
jgi:hypothetical protein